MSATDRRQRIAFLVCEDADGLHVEAHVPRQPETLPMPRPADPPWRLVQRLTLRVVRLLTERVGWMTRDEIAAELGQAPEGDLRPLLTDLAKRGALESSSKRGYSLAIPDDQKPDQYRAWLLPWLTAEEGRLSPDC